MSSCLSGAGGRTCALDLEIIKSPSHSTRTSPTSSPSSTLSEASNSSLASPLAISTRKARTLRKRPKQTYNEAAALLSTAYPNIFSTKHLTNFSKFTPKPPHDYVPQQQFFDESSQLLLPFRVIDDSCFLLHQPIQDKPRFLIEPKVTNFCQNSKLCQSSGEVDFQGDNSMEVQIRSQFDEDFDAESIILDDEIEEGIDSIMGNLQVKEDTIESNNGQVRNNYWYGNPMGIGFTGKLEFGFGLRSGMRAFRQVDEGHWWNFPIDVLQISPKFNSSCNGNGNGNGNCNRKGSSEKKKKKVEKEKHVAESKALELPAKEENSIPEVNSGELLLKLQYDDVLNAWSDKGSPFLDGNFGSDLQGNDVSARLAQIDLFCESGGGRDASVLRYKEKRRTRLFSKKIRYQVRKVNADTRPRLKGRFMGRPNSRGQDEKGKQKVMMLSDL